MRRSAPLVVLLAGLMGCTQSDTTKADAAAAERAAVDPAIAMALANPLMTDPELLGAAQSDVLRPPDRPYQALLPLGSPDPLRGDAAPTVVARLAPLLSGPEFAACDRGVRYSYGWAATLPAAFDLPVDARVAEAAGSERGDCRLRLVAYDVKASPASVVESYRRQAAVAGHRIGERTQEPATLLRGTGTGSAAFIVAIYPSQGGGSSVDFATNRGR